jgi:hypothetical protein
MKQSRVRPERLAAFGRPSKYSSKTERPLIKKFLALLKV